MGSGDRFRFDAAITFELGPGSGEGEQGSGAYSAKLLAGTRQRFSGLSHIRQCGDVVLRMFVTGGPGVRSGGDMPQRIITISRSAPVLRTTGAG